MAAGQPQVVVAFAQALTELVTVEKKNIIVLTEIARDALRTEPAAAPGLAALIATRILQAGAGARHAADAAHADGCRAGCNCCCASLLPASLKCALAHSNRCPCLRCGCRRRPPRSCPRSTC